MLSICRCLSIVLCTVLMLSSCAEPKKLDDLPDTEVNGLTADAELDITEALFLSVNPLRIISKAAEF